MAQPVSSRLPPRRGAFSYAMPGVLPRVRRKAVLHHPCHVAGWVRRQAAGVRLRQLPAGLQLAALHEAAQPKSRSPVSVLKGVPMSAATSFAFAKMRMRPGAALASAIVCTCVARVAVRAFAHAQCFRSSLSLKPAAQQSADHVICLPI